MEDRADTCGFRSVLPEIEDSFLKKKNGDSKEVESKPASFKVAKTVDRSAGM